MSQPKVRSTTQRRRRTWKECGLLRATTSTVIALGADATDLLVGGDNEREEPALGVDGDVAAPAGNLLPAVVAARGDRDGVGRLGDLRVYDARRWLRLPALVLT